MMLDHLFVRLALFAPLGSRDMLSLANAGITSHAYPAREELLRPGERPAGIHFLLSGLSCRYSLLPNGHRQITALLLPGDIVGHESLVHRPCVETVSTLSSTRYAYIPTRAVASWLESCSPLGQSFWGIQALQAEVHRHWLVNVGCRPALQRIAHFFCETVIRSRTPATLAATMCTLPITQIELADITALTPVHVNRILTRLKREKLALFKGGVLRIPDLAALCSLAAFESEYLAALQSWTGEWQPPQSGEGLRRIDGSACVAEQRTYP